MRHKIETLANVASVVACILVIGVMGPQLKEQWFGSGRSGSREQGEPVESIKGLRLTLPADLKGSRSAGIGLIEFADFQCPFCGRYARDTAVVLQREFVDPGKVAYGFRNFPLAQIHRFAMKAAQASVCAGQQRQFWSMHDLMFANQSSLDLPGLLDDADRLRLDHELFSKCLAENSKEVDMDIAEGKRAGVVSTPTFLIGRINNGSFDAAARINGAQPVEVFRKALERALRSVS